MQNTIIYILSALLLLFLVLKEWKRPDKVRKWWRLIASIIAVLCLTALILPINFTYKQKINRSQSLILLTRNFNADSLPTNTTFYSLDDDVIATHKKLKIKRIYNLNEHLILHPEVKKIDLFGNGLNQDLLAKRTAVTINFHQPKIAGFTNVNWPDKIIEGDDFFIAGTFNNLTENNLKLVLKSLSTPADSINLSPNKEQSFNLQTRPKILGKNLFSLAVYDGKKEILKEKIAFEIIPKKASKVLILASNPGFEFKFLKNWLAENNFKVAYRAGTSKNKYQTEFANLNVFGLGNISNSLLRNFDILICDQREINSLSSAEKSVLLKNVQSGLGLFIVAEDASAKVFNNAFILRPNPAVNLQNRKFYLSGENAVLQLNNTGNLNIIKTGKSISLMTDQNKLIMAATKLSGAGKITLTTISNSYQWALAGNKKNYADYWSTLIGESLKKNPQKPVLQIKPQLPVVEEKLSLVYESPQQKLLALKINESLPAQKQHPVLPFKWEANMRINKSGWQMATLSDSLKYWFYVYNKNDWRSVKDAQTVEWQKLYGNKPETDAEKQALTVIETKQPVSKLWFLGLFLLSAGFLWFETKMLS